MNNSEFVKLANSARLANPNKWVFMAEIVEGQAVKYKAFGTSIQILDVEGIRHGGSSDLKVGEFKAAILKALEYRS